MTQWDFDLVKLHGPQEMTAEDRAYRGSRYSEVRKALYQNPYRAGASGQEPGPLPLFRSTIRNAWRGLFSGENKFRQASARSMDSQADLRWGPDGKGWRRIIAPNGICVLGTWEITEHSQYTGYYARGSKGLTIGRFSSDGNETKRGQRRSFSLGMKIYPTTDPEHPTPLIPASVIVQEDLGGMRTAYINDAELVNTPSVHAYRRGIYFLIMLRAGPIFQRLDKVANARQVYQPAELAKDPAVPDSAPPPELDYDMWLGPAPARPYNQQRVHYYFRFFWDYSGGQMTNWGAHHLDIIQWALGMDDAGPTEIVGKGEVDPEKRFEVPSAFAITYKYANGVVVECRSPTPEVAPLVPDHKEHVLEVLDGKTDFTGCIFEGEKGLLYVNRGVSVARRPK